jgi:predicted transcriptional regulator
MVITLDSELDNALRELAHRQGVAPETLVLNALRQQFLAAAALQPRDEWERGLLAAARDCGVSLPNLAVSSEGLYE